jgi:hypothetical protein
MSPDLIRRDVLKAAVVLPLLGAASEKYYTHVLDRVSLEEAIELEREFHNQSGFKENLFGRLRIRRVKPYCEAREGPRKGNCSFTVIYGPEVTWKQAIKFSGVSPDNIDVRPEAKA